MRYSSLTILGLGLAFASWLAACSSTSNTTTGPTTSGTIAANTFQVGDPSASNPNVFVSNNTANPTSLTVPVGTTVTWVWPSGSVDHDVTPMSGSMPAGSGSPQSAPATYSFMFNTAGTYGFYCTVHGTRQGTGMAGQVIVQ